MPTQKFECAEVNPENRIIQGFFLKPFIAPYQVFIKVSLVFILYIYTHTYIYILYIVYYEENSMLQYDNSTF